MKIKSVTVECSALSVDDLPESTLPEFAFLGRSNVGKSSLLNNLSSHPALAKVSSTPGRTRAISVYKVNGSWGLVDLPGYGYAKAPKSARERFSESIMDYLVGRENLRCALVLIDSRHSPQQLDVDFVHWLVDRELPFALVFTKADKLKPHAVKKNIGLFLGVVSEWLDEVPPVFTTSAEKGRGRGELLAFIAQQARSN